jgi:hypothetical protein
VFVGVSVGVCVGVSVGVSVGVEVCVGVSVGVEVFVGVGVGVSPSIHPPQKLSSTWIIVSPNEAVTLPKIAQKYPVPPGNGTLFIDCET